MNVYTKKKMFAIPKSKIEKYKQIFKSIFKQNSLEFQATDPCLKNP